jgi:hypothetical protein
VAAAATVTTAGSPVTPMVISPLGSADVPSQFVVEAQKPMPPSQFVPTGEILPLWKGWSLKPLPQHSKKLVFRAN